ncbi:MAG: hypothetical protein CVV25_02930 [Ignavibacteriae bacterium HGW-Ignavibacteriae-4]|jgi:hypothetical protein|nr:MAG: hypothetical protein CVV25_02930 [Ignavibacteriae bacterium HGW-Ignavibacteriae-4]
MKFIIRAVIAISLIAMFTACSDDEKVTEPTITEAGSITVQDQMISQNILIVKSITVEKDAWVVIHADKNGGPDVPEIISQPVFVKAGTSNDIMVPLTSNAQMLGTNNQLWVMLHTDDGQLGSYEFDGSNGLDAPLEYTTGGIILKAITVTPTTITVSAQSVTNSVTLSVNAATDGWIVIHNSNSDGSIITQSIIGKAAVKAGLNQNIVVQLDNNITIGSGKKIYPMVHIDNEPKGVYNFPGVDAPEVFGFDEFGIPKVIVTSFNTI